jgi:hypothetical protein
VGLVVRLLRLDGVGDGSEAAADSAPGASFNATWTSATAAPPGADFDDRAAASAAAGSLEGIRITPPHFGHLALCPAAESGAAMVCPQPGHLVEIGIFRYPELPHCQDSTTTLPRMQTGIGKPCIGKNPGFRENGARRAS